MRNKVLAGVLIGCFLIVLPFWASAKDENSGKRVKIKNAEVLKVDPAQGLIVVESNGATYNFMLGLADPKKTELLSKYGIMVDFADLQPGDHITCRGRRFSDYFIPSKCRMEKDSQKDLYKDRTGVMVADVYAVDSVSGLIYAAHSLNKTDLTTIKQGDSKITYQGENRSISKLEPYWRLKIKGEYDKEDEIFRKIEYIKIIKKHTEEPGYYY